MASMTNKLLKIVVFVPESHADLVREAIGRTEAGTIGNYTECTFSVSGTGRFRSEQGAHPATGQVGELAEERMERIEAVCPRDILQRTIAAIKEVHPYETVGIDIYPLEDLIL